jgi:hypothetical protein
MSLQYNEGHIRKYQVGMSGLKALEMVQQVLQRCLRLQPQNTLSQGLEAKIYKNTLATTTVVADKFNISYLSLHSMTFVKLLPQYYTE